MKAATPGQAACDAFWEAARGQLARTGDGWDWAIGDPRPAWEEAARAVLDWHFLEENQKAAAE